jgi:glycosyltransferase involved in cell wall biosynthesis
MTVAEWPRVTWTLPVLNGMPFLGEMLESIAAQTYRNRELIAWDNGSTDESVALLRAWIPARIPGRVITGKPLLLGLARARLTKLATTALCASIDADDVHLPTLVNLPDRLVRYRRHGASETGLITDFIDAERAIAVANADTLFPAFERARALELWEAANPYAQRYARRLDHLNELREAARNAAEAVGAPAEYFTSTAFYRRQQQWIFTSLIYRSAPPWVRQAARTLQQHAPSPFRRTPPP